MRKQLDGPVWLHYPARLTKDEALSRETDVSTKQSGAQAPSRVPRADGLGRRPQGSGTSPGEGSQEADGVGRASSASSRLTLPPRLKLRRQFLRVADGAKAHMPSLVAQARLREPADSLPAKVGFTASKRVGNSVARNRARRRLREAVRLGLVDRARPGCDYVFVARVETLSREWPDLLDDVKGALISLHRKLDAPRRAVPPALAEPRARGSAGRQPAFQPGTAGLGQAITGTPTTPDLTAYPDE